MSGTRAGLAETDLEDLRFAFESLERFRDLRDSVLRSLDLPLAGGVLYGLGFREGLVCGRRLANAFEHDEAEARGTPGPAVPVLFQPERADGARIAGCLTRSPEAEIHLSSCGEGAEPACWMSAGFAAGYYTELLDREVLVRELACRASGAGRCLFDCREVTAWQEARDPVIAELLAYLDIPALRKTACDLASEPREAEGDLLGSFDPMSPAAHVWGPVVVLPYSGSGDSDQALQAILSDADVGRLSVVVIDLNGVHMDAIEATGLAVFLDRVTALELQPLVVGLEPGVAEHFSRGAGGLAAPLFAPSLSEGIALGFQVSLPSRKSQ